MFGSGGRCINLLGRQFDGLLANCTIVSLFIVCNLPVHILASRMIAAERHFWYAIVVTILPVCGLVILLVPDPMNLLRPLYGDWAPDPTLASAVVTRAADVMVTLGGVFVALVVARYALLMLCLGTWWRVGCRLRMLPSPRCVW